MDTRAISTPLMVSATIHAALIAWIASQTDVASAMLGGDSETLVLTEVELLPPAPPSDLAILAPASPAPAPNPVPAPAPAPDPTRSANRAAIPTPNPGATQSIHANAGATATTTGPMAGTLEPGPLGPPSDRATSPSPAVATPNPTEAARAIEPDPGPPPPPSPLAPPRRRKPRKPRSELVPDGNGTYRGEESVFTGRVGRDGKVAFDDKPNFRVHLALPGASDVGETLEDWYADPYGHASRDERAVETHTVTVVRGGFDLTDWAMRSSGQDPYSFRKAAFLDRTRNQRAQLSANEESENLRDSLAHLPEFLARVWSYDSWSKSKRRQTLFDLWDECAEQGSKGVLSASRAARATIIAFIRRELPEDDAAAYSAAEIRDLNSRRKSQTRFEPYE